ncbi:magnesium transporter NIPA-domain-containing protein [Aspergillus pseudotamarii]|uniref:Magnesium transporter NIPA-domain-containing protein n=1 Tax=Aspergillus pseudotamarii TaxID=132259 RepID=A0A5N6SPN8_ASPPS|nr:magnesium transporter NIPA-domain-containing protein [Aspergillus pseudotamarii]KAE8136662.1 magnesium transporter NIPA-domain-containing protein [Aspergillus pseudotamarii]
MAYLHEVPLAAGLLTSFISSAAPPTPTLSPLYVFPSSQPSPTLASDPGDDGRGGGGGMHQWSSLIGIVTALIGNILISLALNIQRYAHIRIEREWEHQKLQKEAEWKRANPGRGSTDTYGSVAEHEYSDYETRGRNQSRRFGRYRDESPEVRFVHHDQPHIDLGPEDDDDMDTDAHQDQMNESFMSDRTVRPGDPRRKSYLRSPYWWVGIVLMCVGEIGNFMAYGFAPASIVSPLGVVALISNCVIAPIMLKEKFRGRDFWGVVVAVTGAVVVVLSASSSEEKIGPHEIWVMITRWEFETYVGISTVLIIGLLWASGKYGSRTVLIDVGLVALFGGYTALSTKGVSSLLSFTLWHVITFPITYLLVFVLVFSAVLQIRYINRALQRFDSTQVIPTQFVLFTLSVIIGSAVLYRDFENYTLDRAGKFIGGCLLTFLGVYFITSGRVRSDDESSYSADDEEEAIGLLAGERYRDSVDMLPSARHVRVQKPSRTPLETQEEHLQSPSGSLLSHGTEGINEGQRTPRGVSSAAPSSPIGSLTAESLTEQFPEPSPPVHPNSLLTNPWADVHESAIETPKSEPQIPQIDRPVTPEQSRPATSGSPVLLRFPPAPGIEDNNLKVPAASGTETASPGSRTNTVPQTPPARRLRNSISSRFSPGPLLPTISAGFSAVVAESLRRGETSPVKDRKFVRRHRGKQLSTTIVDGFLRNRDGESANIDEGLDPRGVLPTARFNSTGDIATAPVTAGQSTTTLDTEDAPQNLQPDSSTSVSRIRSLSDSWGGGLAWLGGTLRKVNGHGNEHEQIAESQTNEEETGTNTQM